MHAVNLKTNHMTDPMGIDGNGLWLSWNCAGGVRQSAYRVRIVPAAAGDAPLWDSGKVMSGDMHVRCPISFGGRMRASWTVELWDENEEKEDAQEQAFFETGLPAEGSRAKWVNPELTQLTLEECPCTDVINAFARESWEQKQEEKEPEQRQPYVPHQPASYLRKTFDLPSGRGDAARLYITARGLYVAWINGKRVGDRVLSPGAWTGNHHLGVQTCDVTELLKEGANELLIALGDGWHRSTTGVDGDRNLFGEEIGIWFQLEAGGEVICASDETMEASQCGPIRQNDMQQGEVYDARMEEITGWHGVSIMQGTEPRLCGMNSVPILEQETFGGRLFTAPNGETVLDFGQNLAGYVEITLNAHAGQQLTLLCGETLDADGNFTNENFQDRNRHKEGGTLQALQLICREGENHYKPSFTIMGFRYAKVDTDLEPEQLLGARFTAHAVYSQMAQTSWFECAKEDVNQLFRNSIWSMKGNFCDVPTDCPTRERAGWTGDMGVFADTGLYLMDCYPVIEKWLGECRANQYPDGRMANIAPPNGKGSFMTQMLCSSSGWGDAAIIVPYTLYRRCGDPKILEDNYEMMQRWYAFLKGRAAQTKPEQEDGPYAQYTVLNGIDYGEWCEPGISAIEAMKNMRKSVGTAYLAYSGRLLSEIANILGKHEDAQRYHETSELARKAFRYTFTDDGVIHSDRQCEYVRAIQFSLLTGEEAKAAAGTLNQMIIDNGYHLNTGFLSTPFLCGVLAENGYTDTAYRLLLQEEAPGWLYAVQKGATTVWETWEGIDADGNPHESLNHYSYGAVCGWLISGVCGIKIMSPSENAAEGTDLSGNTVMIRPYPDPQLGWAKAVYDSPSGRIESGWSYEGENIVFDIALPANVSARVILPDGSCRTIAAGRTRLQCTV